MSKAFSALTAAVLLLLALTGSVLATDNNNETVISISDCPDPVVTITLRVLDEDEQANGAVTYRVRSGDATVIADTTVETDEAFEATITHPLPAGEYVIRWDDETQIDSSFDERSFEVPVCQTPTPTPTGDVAPIEQPNPTQQPPQGGVAPTTGVAPTSGTGPTETLPATDTFEAAHVTQDLAGAGVVLLVLGIGSLVTLFVALGTRTRRVRAEAKERIEY